jgi:hypothetical protein
LDVLASLTMSCRGPELGSALSRAPRHPPSRVPSSHRWLLRARGPRLLVVAQTLEGPVPLAADFSMPQKGQIYFPGCSHPQSPAACQGETEQGALLQPCAQRVQGTRAMLPGACMLCAAWPLGSCRRRPGCRICQNLLHSCQILRQHMHSIYAIGIAPTHKFESLLIKLDGSLYCLQHVLLCSIVKGLICMHCIRVGYCPPISN